MADDSQHDHITKPMEEALRAMDAGEALPDDASEDEHLEAAMAVIATGREFLQALARDPAPGVEDVAAEHRQDAIQTLLALQDRMQETLPGSLDIIIDVASSTPETPPEGLTDEDRETARAILLDNGFLTEGELATFPRESLYSIARQRLARWEETGDARA
jgi:hypothetical protein